MFNEDDYKEVIAELKAERRELLDEIHESRSIIVELNRRIVELADENENLLCTVDCLECELSEFYDG